MTTVATSAGPAAAPVSPSSVRRWKRRKYLWDGIFIGLFRGIITPPLPKPNNDKVRVVGWKEAHGQPLALLTGYPIPRDEFSRLKDMAKNVVVRIRDAVPPIVGDAPRLPAENDAMLKAVWTAGHEWAFPKPPRIPSTFAHGLDLGRLVVEGPFFESVTRRDDNTWIVDLRGLDAYPYHPDTVKLGTITEFDVDAATRRLRARSIHHPSSGRTFRPGDTDWDYGQRLVSCALFTDAAYIQHLVRLHMLSSGYLSCAVRNDLSATHPIKALLWSHIYGVLDVNNTLGPTLVCDPRGVIGDFCNITHAGLWSWANDYAGSFRVELLDPELSLKARGADGAPFNQPTMDDTLAIWKLIQAYTHAWVECYYPSDADLAADRELVTFLVNLDKNIMNGIRALVPEPARPTRAQLAHLCAAFIHSATVLHHIYGSLMWNYAPWARYIPPRLGEDGAMPAGDVYQRMLNALFVTNVPSRRLMEDASHVAPTPAGAAVMRAFISQLRERQAELSALPHEDWRVYPENLDASIAV